MMNSPVEVHADADTAASSKVLLCRFCSVVITFPYFTILLIPIAHFLGYTLLGNILLSIWILLYIAFFVFILYLTTKKYLKHLRSLH